MENEDLISYKNLLEPLEDLYQDLKADFFKYDSSAAESYQSRYLDDFEPLNSAEIGLISDTVFKAKNKLDGQDYTIERITLPEEKNDRIEILGMVKVLARNDHRRLVNFIRYNQAWLECPPSGWQEEKYKNWANKTRVDSESVRPTRTGKNRRVSILSYNSSSENRASFYQQLTTINDSSPSSSNKSPGIETSTSDRPNVYLYVQMQLLKDLKTDSSTFLEFRNELRSHLRLTSNNLKKSYKSSNGSFYSNREELRRIQDLENKLIKKNETNVVSASEATESQNGIFELNFLEPDSSASKYYRSRYLDDFQEIEKLGSGSFGAVFKAKNKFDDRLYAIKRIKLNHREGVQERDLREVKALAKFNNNNIVRYYQTWVECPTAALNNKWKRENRMSDEFSNSDTTTPQSNSKSAAVSFTTETDGSGFSDAFQNLNLSEKITSDSSAPRNMNGSGSSSIVFRKTPASSSAEPNEYESAIALKNSSSSNFDGPAAGDKKSTGNRLNYYLFIQMELCSETTLKDWLLQKSKRRPPFKRLLEMFRQIVAAVRYIHSRDLIHRDLKPSNIFFSPTSGRIKVGDLGLVVQIDEDSDFLYSQSIGTPLYKSPEQILKKPYTNKVDIYALGLIFFELLTTFETEMERYKYLVNLRENIFPPDFESTWSKEIVKLLKLMLSEEPLTRPSAAEIKSEIVKLKKM